MGNWTLLSNHGHVLVCLVNDSAARLRDIAANVGITERAVQKIVRDLQDSDMITVSKHGRRNNYSINLDKSLRHQLEAHCSLGELTELLASNAGAISVNDPKLKPVASKQVKAKAFAIRPIESKPVKPESIESAAGKSGPAEVNIIKPKEGQSEKPEKAVTNPIERQQGSLF